MATGKFITIRVVSLIDMPRTTYRTARQHGVKDAACLPDVSFCGVLKVQNRLGSKAAYTQHVDDSRGISMNKLWGETDHTSLAFHSFSNDYPVVPSVPQSVPG
jgi:hypothetical protein